MNAINLYFDELKRVLDLTLLTQKEQIESASKVCADVLLNDGLIYTFGTGHSHILAEEIFYRAGGLAAVYPIMDDPLMLTHAARSSKMERFSGYAELLMEEINPKSGSVIFIFSNSGRNAVPIEMALAAKKRGLTVICITNMNHTNSTTSRHESGKKLFEVCDIVIDNCGCIGDASIELFGRKSGATSTAVGTAILQAITCRTVELCDGKAEVYCSANADGGDQINDKYIEKYRGIIKPL